MSYLLSTTLILLLVSIPADAKSTKPTLRFKADGTIKILQFTDTHHAVNADPRTILGMSKMLDQEMPDFVVITGDCVPGDRCKTINDMKIAVKEIAQPMEKRNIPWAITFGNHDLEHLPTLGLTKSEVMTEYMSFHCNINKQGPRNVFGTGNDFIQIQSSTSDASAYGIWLLDSNMYAPERINGQKMGGYDWIRPSQIKWYVDKSINMQKRYDRKIPSLMFFHIPLREFIDIYEAGNTTGEMNEAPCPPPVNSGLFTSLLERGDVKGVFVGHEHINTYTGDWYGIKLGYSGGTGYSTYGLSSDDDTIKNRLRGARVFDISENDLDYFDTSYITFDSLEK
ncbi:MAG: metallophosphoesterase family protein [Armatimonadota bacterium]